MEVAVLEALGNRYKKKICTAKKGSKETSVEFIYFLTLY
jgi:hypothetical protein